MCKYSHNQPNAQPMPSQCEKLNEYKIRKNWNGYLVAATGAVAVGVVRRNNYIPVGSLVRHTYCVWDAVASLDR